MPKDPDQLVSQSLLEKLTDVELSLKADPPITRAQSIRNLKASLRRDLEWLFNSRANHDCPLPTEMPEVFRSVYNYGLPDFTHLSMSNSSDREKLQKQLELAMTIFEPRLAGVTVRLVETGFEVSRSLRFQIDGFLQMDPAPEHISFDTVLDIPSGEYLVKGETSAG
jgi:type VI secretion system protein ImpF